MARNFSTSVLFNKKKLPAVLLPVMLADGLHYEVNVKGHPRFMMRWSELGRYDLVENEEITADDVPYELVLAVSEVLDKLKK